MPAYKLFFPGGIGLFHVFLSYKTRCLQEQMPLIHEAPEMQDGFQIIREAHLTWEEEACNRCGLG